MSRVDKQARRDASSSFNGMITPDAVANDVFDAIIDERFYILTHPESTHERVRTRMNDIVKDRQPSPLGGPQSDRHSKHRRERPDAGRAKCNPRRGRQRRASVLRGANPSERSRSTDVPATLIAASWVLPFPDRANSKTST